MTIFWFRRDLRLKDNAGLYHALKKGAPVLPIFIFDTEILDELKKDDARVDFIHQTITNLSTELKKLGSSLLVKYGQPLEMLKDIVEEFPVQQVFTNHDYEPYAIQRDKAVQDFLKTKNIDFKTYKDHLIFEKNEVLKKDGTPYTVFTPYSKVWKATLHDRKTEDQELFYVKSYPTEKYVEHFYETDSLEVISLEKMGFKPSDISFPSDTVTQKIIKEYDKKRDFPAENGTSRLGLHFRFGTISIREKARKALLLNETYLNELIWRDFYAMILFHFPKVVTQPFRDKYAAIPWRDEEADFEKWCAGKTGYPIVDAGMRQLNETGYMHNRVRMVVASFLTKHLLLNWQWGEAYFAEKLLDFDLASNNGGWQWAAGCGTDAAPYFRVFNPESQQKKFDKNFEYIKKWVPEFGTDKYPEPMVEHKFARERYLRVVKEAINQ